MSILSSKFCKNKNNTDISLYQTWLLTLHENILQYYRLHLLKKNVIVFKHSFQTT